VRRGLAAILVACAIATAAACGGSSGDDATEAASTAAPPPTGATTAATAPADDLASRLPAEDAVAGVRPGDVRPLPTAEEFVAALYQAGDPARDAARRRLEEGGYADGVIRDQAGDDPQGGVALLRSYAIRMGDDEAARAEVAAAAAEVEGSELGEATAIDVPDVEDARGLRVEVSQGGIAGQVVFLTFAEGPYVQGIQAVARAGADLPQDEVVRAAQDLAARLGSS
jgi:hypothetical protein